MAKSALRVLQIMEFIAEQRNGCSHAEIAKSLGIPKGSLTALLADLIAQRYLQRDSETGRYSIGLQVLSLANSYLRSLSLARLGTPIVGALYASVKHFSTLAIPSGTEYVVICTESVPALFTHSLQIGYRGPLFCSAVGRAIMAYLPEDRVNEILLASTLRPLTPATKIDPTEIKAELAVVRKTGVAYGREENIPGITGIAAPVFDRTGTPIAAVGVAAATNQVAADEWARIEAATRIAADRLSEQLGWQGSDARLLPSKSFRVPAS